MAYYPLATEFEAPYRLVGPDGAVAVFNDPTDPNYVGMLTEVTGLDSADVRESAADLVEADGGAHGAFYLGRRPITLTGRVFGHATVLERATRMDRARRACLALRGDAMLSWKTASALENLVANPRGQNDTTGWLNTGGGVNTGGTITRVTGQTPPVGTTAIQVATSGSGNINQGTIIAVTVTAGKAYAVSIAARRTAGTGTGEVFVAGTNSITLTSTVNSATWTTYTTTFTAASNGTVYIGIKQGSSNTAASTFQLSDAMIAPGSDTTYRDGDTSGWFWQGTTGNSASGNFIERFTTVRRAQPFRESGGWNKDFMVSLVSEFAYIFGTTLKTAASGVAAENRGNMPAYPVLVMSAPSVPVIDPTFTDGTRVFRTTGLTIAVGETVEFDMTTHTGVFTAGARNGQSANRYINFSTTAWPYLTGNGTSQTFTISAGTGSIRYRDTWA